MVKIITNNVNGLNNDTKRRSLFYDLRCKADIVCLQETHSSVENEIFYNNEWGGQAFWSHGSTAKRGVCILIKKCLGIEIEQQIQDTEGRMIGISFKYKGELFALVNIYAPNEDNPEFFVNMCKTFEKLEGKKIILGDFNLALDDTVDRTDNSSESHKKSVEIVQSFMENAFLVKLLLSDTMVKQFAENALCQTMQQDVWLCNISIRDAKICFKESFWRDVLVAWAQINYKNPCSPTEMATQIIWYNSFLRINDKPFFLVVPYKEGLKEIGQMFNASGGIIPCKTCCDMFKLTIMQRNSIMSAIPKEWKSALSTEIETNQNDNFYESFIKKEKIVRYYNNLLLSEESCLVKCYNHWRKDANYINLDFDEFCNLFCNIYKITNQAKLRSFQYRLLHKAIILNDRLKAWKIVEVTYVVSVIRKPKPYIIFSANVKSL